MGSSNTIHPTLSILLRIYIYNIVYVRKKTPSKNKPIRSRWNWCFNVKQAKYGEMFILRNEYSPNRAQRNCTTTESGKEKVESYDDKATLCITFRIVHILFFHFAPFLFVRLSVMFFFCVLGVFGQNVLQKSAWNGRNFYYISEISIRM